MMFVIGIRYLNSWAMGSGPASYEEPEWPPHPDRVFMALLSAHFEYGGEPQQLETLRWLEQQGPPELLASPAHRRKTVATFVPVNDRKDPVRKGKALAPAGSMPIGRERQPRQFPVAIPYDLSVYLIWRNGQLPKEHRKALSQMCDQVTCIGHSASFVQTWVGDAPINSEPTTHRLLRPVNVGATYRLRIFGPGRLDYLLRQFKAGLRPVPSIWSGYGISVETQRDTSLSQSHFNSKLLMLKQVDGRRFGLDSTLQLATALRGAVMHHAIQPLPSWISGHNADGSRAERKFGHIAFFPIPHVGHERASGHLMGMGIAVPYDIHESEISRQLNPMLFRETGLPKRVHLVLGRLGECVLEIADVEDPRYGMQPEIWTGPARRWATVTPIALDRHAKGKNRQAQFEQFIAEGCERLGLPRPVEVIPTPAPIMTGALHARDMPRISRKRDGGKIRQTHAVLVFKDQVRGPLLVGAGRYRGYGLCRPLQEVD
ncbi:MAG: type I-U CRISPR-associated protein Cas5/Cas6 [Planctomycetaceae bacterium]|nr:type I-U CRISPR-associated protein Cas5/Cas6 [Planctomycetaceae bacterium]